MKVLYVQADTNDADYVVAEHPVTDEEVQRIVKIVDKLMRSQSARKDRPYDKTELNWENGERGNSAGDYVDEGILTLDEAELFENYLPYGEYGIHTVKTIEVREVEVLQKVV